MESILSQIRWDVIWNYRELFFRGIWMTLFLTLSGFILGLLFGLIIGIGKIAKRKWINIPASAYIDLFRGTPLLVQIMLIHFAVVPFFLGKSQAIVSGVVALTLNSAAYIAEIFRAGIQSMDKGQMEAARSLGMSHFQAMGNVILPQAFKRMIPPLGNEYIALLKDSSLLAFVAVNELAYAGRTVAGATFRPWEAYLTIMVLYLILTIIFTRFVSFMERRMDIDRRS